MENKTNKTTTLEIARINDGLAVAEARLVEVTAQLADAREKREHYRQIAEPAMLEFRRIHDLTIKLDSVRRENLARIQRYKIRLAKLADKLS